MRTTAKPKGKWPVSGVVEVEWFDSSRRGGWERVERYEEDVEPCLCRTIGYVISDTKDHLTLVQSQGAMPSPQVTDSMCIPKVCILGRRELGFRDQLRGKR